MTSDDLRRRLARLESSLNGLSVEMWGEDELISAMRDSKVTPPQMAQVFVLVEEDIRTQAVLSAAERRLGYSLEERPRTPGRPVMPFDQVIEMLRWQAEDPVEGLFTPVSYDPEVWVDRKRFSWGQRFGSVWWARSFLLERLLGADGGRSLREAFDRWWEGGDPPLDIGRYPHESVYWLLEPIDTTASFLDYRMLRIPTKELYDRIGTYDRFDDWEDGHYWTLWTPETSPEWQDRDRKWKRGGPLPPL